ncbi:MAG: hypothetical protein RR839_00100 [Oscillospiraceae bacterium]
MNDKEYEKCSYKLFIVWFVAFISMSFLVPFLIGMCFPNIGENIMIKLILAFTLIGLSSLFYLIYKTEKVYWINGITYDMAKKSTSEKRKIYAFKHFEAFLNATIYAIIYLVISTLLRLSPIVDGTVVGIMIIVTAVKTIKTKL